MEKISFQPQEFGIFPNTGKDMCEAFRKLFQAAADTDGDKKLVLAPGVYDFYAENAERLVLYISNTVAEREMKIPTRTVPLRLSGIKNFVLEGEGAEFLMHGLVTNLYLEHCENIAIKGVAIDHLRPSVSELTVVKKSGLTAIFQANPDSPYKMKAGKPVFYGDNFEVKAASNVRMQWANVRLAADNPDMILRWKHPFYNARKYKDLGGGKLEVKYWIPPFAEEGDRYALHESKRKEVGIFVEHCDNIHFDGVKEYYNHSHAYVAQMSKNITLTDCCNAPRPGSPRFTSSQTDYLHFSMCGGKITVKDSVFNGAFDDVFNVHGFHFKVVKTEVDTVRAKFMHPQAYGFLPFEEGDKVEFIAADTLVPTGVTAVVQQSKMIDKYTVELILDTAIQGKVNNGCMIENISKCADVEFCGNKMKNITTRGLLITTRGKVLIENNDFYKTGMSGVLISDDARSWFESGCVRDVTIKNNRFECCGEQALYVYPEYAVFEKPVHKNIVFEDNEIIVNKTRAIKLRGAENVVIGGNTIVGAPGKEGYIVQDECKNVKISNNNLPE